MRYFIFIAMTLLASCANRGAIKLSERGHSDYVIRIPDNPAGAEDRAARFLQTYLKKAGGAELPILAGDGNEEDKKIILIQTDPSISHEDGFRIRIVGDSLIILGGRDKGCIYGVVDLLEKQLGCRMYAPGYEVVPARRTIRIPAMDYADEPVNVYRNVHGRFVGDPDYQDWQRIDRIDDLFAIGYYVHTFNRLVPWEHYFEKHPDYYAWMNGKRIIDQICLTHPEVLNIAKKKLREEMLLQPDKLYWSVSQNDNFSYCQCSNCRKVIEEEGSPAGPVIRFVNEIAREFPDKIISTLAYQYSRQAPGMTVPESNVQIMLCTIELNRSQPIAEDERSASFMKDIVDWGKIANHIYLWDYTVNFSHHVTPFPNLHVLQPNIRMFVDNHVSYHFQQSNTDVGHEFSELKSYLIARLLWDPDVNADSLVTDFLQGYFGKAAPFIRSYMEALQAEITNTGEWLDIYGHPTAHQETFLSEENIKRYLGYFSQAREAAKDDPDRLLHVRTYELPVQYAAMEIGKNQMFSSRGWFARLDSVYELRPAMKEMLESFYLTCKEAGVSTLSEAGLAPEDYYRSTLRFLDLKVEGNLAFRREVAAIPPPSSKYSSGDISYLTNGVSGATDYKVHWLGWEASDFTFSVDLGSSVKADSIRLASLYDPKSWIFHPQSVTCLISVDGKNYLALGTQVVGPDQRNEPVIRTYHFNPAGHPVRFVRFDVRATLRNPDWHPSPGRPSWVFLDEVVVK
ncbi:MAG: DUF4838 domain-containing protein [Bacteroidales bacterium]